MTSRKFDASVAPSGTQARDGRASVGMEKGVTAVAPFGENRTLGKVEALDALEHFVISHGVFIARFATDCLACGCDYCRAEAAAPIFEP
jgi:hypothetical protein